VLARNFRSIDNLAGQTVEDLTRVHEVGPVVAESIYNFFHNQKNIEVLDKLKKGGVLFPEEKAELKESALTERPSCSRAASIP